MARQKKGVSSIVSGAGVLTAIFTELDRKVREYGGGDEDLHHLTTPDGLPIIGQMAQVIMDARGGQLAGPLTVDYGRSIEDYLVAGRYDGYVDEAITTEHFPLSGQGVATLNPVFVQVPNPPGVFSTNVALAEIKRRRLRPGTAQEDLAVGEQYPELQRQFPIVALGSFWANPDGDRYVVGLRGDDSTRRADLDWDGHAWHPVYRFLAFSE